MSIATIAGNDNNDEWAIKFNNQVINDYVQMKNLSSTKFLMRSYLDQQRYKYLVLYEKFVNNIQVYQKSFENKLMTVLIVILLIFSAYAYWTNLELYLIVTSNYSMFRSKFCCCFFHLFFKIE